MVACARSTCLRRIIIMRSGKVSMICQHRLLNRAGHSCTPLPACTIRLTPADPGNRLAGDIADVPVGAQPGKSG